MALTKETSADKVEVVGQFKFVQVRTATVIKEDGVQISKSFTRKVLTPGVLDPSQNLVNTDLSSETAEVRGICTSVWTDEIKAAYRTHLINTINQA